MDDFFLGSSPNRKCPPVQSVQSDAALTEISAAAVSKGFLHKFPAVPRIFVPNSRILNFGVADEKAWEVGLSCGGKIRILVEMIN